MPDVKSARMMCETMQTIMCLQQKKHELLNAGRLPEAAILSKEIARKLDEYIRFSDTNQILSAKNS
jgi:hypothetical protein